MVVAQGTPEEVAAVAGSYTGQFLAELVTPKAAKVRANGGGANGKGPNGANGGGEPKPARTGAAKAKPATGKPRARKVKAPA
jgi:excinuclease ABC subunit A